MSVIVITIVSTSQASEELSLADDQCKATHERLTLIQSAFLRVYNVSIQLIGSVKGMFVESMNTRKIM